MQIDIILLTGFLFAVSTWLILQGSFVKVLFGFTLLSSAANLVVLAVSGDPAGKLPSIVSDPNNSTLETLVDPLPQALILTAIVIGFGVTAYLVLLLYRIFLDRNTTSVFDLYDSHPTNKTMSEDGKEEK